MRYHTQQKGGRKDFAFKRSEIIDTTTSNIYTIHYAFQ